MGIRKRRSSDAVVKAPSDEAISAPEPGANGNGHGGRTSSLLHEGLLQSRSRRDVLFRAGAVAVASVGALSLLDQRRVEAATAGPFILGASNNADATSGLVPTTSAGPSVLLNIDQSGVTFAAGVSAVQVTNSPGNVALEAFGNANSASTLGLAIFATGTGGSGAIVATTAGTGAAIIGQSASGFDLQASGSGRLHQNGVLSGPPGFSSTNQESVRDVQGVQWLSNGAGGWYPTQVGGLNIGFFSAVVTTQKTLASSNGATWKDMDATNLHLVITPKFSCQAIVTVNADLWTTVAGFNQDIGVRATSSTAPPGVGLYPTTAGQPEGWKESGGPAAFSPNAAFLQTVLPMRAGLTYNLFVVWKANKPAAGTSIIAGAGPIGGKFSPTRMSVQLVTDSHANVGAAPVHPPAKKPTNPKRPWA
jgi:hypothetical protein